ncbi:MAG: 4-phosphoerythronate dehydrogenase PdxB [Bacteroidales bacterium]|nr:4-phosphoerythronate dehydrogenase PdxB [Bacteroidales bacterium]
MKIVVDDNIPFLEGTLEPFAEVVYLPGRQISREILIDADALLIRTRTKCTESLLKGTNVRFIGTATIGFDHIDIQFCEKNKIFWTNAPGCNSSSVQQYIAATLLKLAMDHKFTLKDKTIGIVGVGNVGSKVEKLARILGMNVLLNDPPRARIEGDKNFVNLDNILYESDIITIHLPLSFVGDDKTYHLFNGKSFNKMKKGTWFFNSARGEVTDTNSLKKALVSGKLGGAVIDVWENEPDIDIELMTKSFISTPHIAGYSTDGKANGTAIVVKSLCEYFDLPLKSWYPDNVPQPSTPDLKIDGKGKSEEEIIREAVFHTYNISQDDLKFRFSPTNFEKRRGVYRVRREFSSYSVKCHDCTKKSHKKLEDLGFRVIV